MSGWSDDWTPQRQVGHGQAGGQVDTDDRPPPELSVRPRRRHWGRIVAIVLVLLLVALLGFAFWIDSRLNRIDALSDYAGRPAVTPGTDWLVVGSDSRAG